MTSNYIYTCEICDTRFERKRAPRNYRVRACSMDCARRLPKRRAGRDVEKTCETCNCVYRISIYKQSISRFCSRQCLNKFVSKNKLIYTDITERTRKHREDPRRNAARNNIYYHVQAGNILKPNMCQKCHTIFADKSKIQAHHHMGYDRENWLNVEWLCQQCHQKEHPRKSRKKKDL